MSVRTGPGRGCSPAISRLCLLVFGLITLGGPVPDARAQAPTDSLADQRLLELSLEQLTDLPVLTVVTAARREQTTTQAPAQATVISADDIRHFGYRTLADILRSAPGFYVNQNHSYGFVGVRGFGRPGDYGGRLLLLLDGHRMNDPLYDTVAVLDDFVLDIDLIERVEIIRGPGSSLYGNNAFFGVVNVITKWVPAPAQLEVAAQGGAQGTWRGRATWSGSAAHGTEALVSVSRSDAQGLTRIYLPEYDSPETNGGVILGGDDGEATNLFARLRKGRLTLLAAHVGRDKGNPLPQYGTRFGTSVRTTDNRGLLEGRYEGPLGDDLRTVARLYYDAYDYRADYHYGSTDSGAAAGIVVNRDESRLRSIGSEVQINWNPTVRQDLTIGAEYRFDFRESIRNFDLSPRAEYLDLDREGRVYAFFIQDEHRPLRQLSLTAGLRYDHFDTFGATLNPRLACVLGPVDATTVKLLYGTAFRAPNASEFHYQDSARTIKLNPGLGAERIRTYEIVCERSFGRRWRGSAAVFQNTVRGLIDTAQDPVDSLYYSVNRDRVRARGLDVGVECQLSRTLAGRASYTVTRTRDEATDATPDNSPERLARLNLTLPTFVRGVQVSWEGQYMSERIAGDGRTFDGGWLVNVTLLARAAGGRLEITTSLYNLLDRHYRDVTASPESVAQDGRTLRARIAGRF